MIIRPANRIPIAQAEGTEFDLVIFNVYQTRDDYAADHNGQQPPPPDPTLRAKHWYDPDYSDVKEDDGEVAAYTVVHYDPVTGQPRLTPYGTVKTTMLVLPTYIAGRVNIGTGVANEFPLDTPFMRFKPYPFPIRPLHMDEEILPPKTPFGGVVVVNKRLKLEQEIAQAEAEGKFTKSDREALQEALAILRRLEAQK